MYWRKGRVTRQAHVHVPEGTYEEEFGRKGFAGRVAHIYRAQPPVGWTNIEGDLRPESLNVTELGGKTANDWIANRSTFLENADLRLAFARLDGMMPYHFRNADGDEVLFVHSGVGRMETDFGPLSYRKGDYLVVPRGTVYRLEAVEPSSFLVIESADEIEVPDRGLLGKHALFDLDVVEVPEPAPNVEEPGREEWDLKIQRQRRVSTVTYPFNPITTVGWKGDLTVWRLNVEDIRPVLSERYHLPPSAHATFATGSMVIATFLPRPLEDAESGSLKVPFYHSNVDYDEVLFYHDGEFFSRAGIGAGMVTFHPQGIHHGPHPKAIERANEKRRTDEVAVMIDTIRPLNVTDAGRDVANPDYWKSWQSTGAGT